MPWGIHVSHHDGRFFGVGSVHHTFETINSHAFDMRLYQ
jgi:hypothetical protein